MGTKPEVGNEASALTGYSGKSVQKPRVQAHYRLDLKSIYVFSKPYIGGKTTNIGFEKRVLIPSLPILVSSRVLE